MADPSHKHAWAARLAALAAAFCTAAPAPAYAQETIVTDNLLIAHDGVSAAEAQAFAREAERAYKAVTGYLGREPERIIAIRVGERYDVPTAYHGRSAIVVGANRVRGDGGGAGRWRALGPAIAHEITHLVAGQSRAGPGQFLDEGLAVFVQEKFKLPDDRSFPNMGRDLHEETVRWSRQYGRLVPLAETHQARWLAGGPRDLIYLQAGSFVRFLVEGWGLAKFMALYDGQGYVGVYGRARAALEADWLEFLRTVRAE
ncbi:MAG: hypothetical protein ACT4N4_14855 [Rhodospirillales bacterium]